MAARGGQWFQEEQPFLDDQFDIFDWHPYFQSCVRYFLEHAQYNGPVQALAAFINILLPFQKAPHHHHQNPLLLSRASPGPVAAPGLVPPPIPPGAAAAFGGGPLPPPAAATAANPLAHGQHQPQTYPPTLLQPYIRRLVVTGFDVPAVLHGFFGDDWVRGIRPLHERERRNYLFAAKSSSWLEVKRAYDMGEGETVPFLKPLGNVTEEEIVGCEREWSGWLEMQDWMLGPRSLDAQGAGSPRPAGGGGVRVKQERED